MRIADVRPQSLVMRAAVDEEDIAQVNVGQVVRMTLYAFPGRTFDGKVLRIYDEADSSRRTFEVEVGIDEPDPRLAPGMTGELAFVVAEKLDATIIPAQAAYDDALYVVHDGRVRRLPAKFGLRSVDRVEVLSELSPQELVVIGLIDHDSDGDRVNTRFTDPKQANGLTSAATAGSATQPVTHAR
jgi:multidrug efflux pump subunit AcrA (membrane-fusion protein)